MSLPDWLRDKLASPPSAGAGIHAYLFSCARQLHAHMDSRGVFDALQSAVEGVNRPVPAREIRDAVNNSLAVAWRPRPFGEMKDNANPLTIGCGEVPASRWPRVCPRTRRAMIADAEANGVGGLYELWEASPFKYQRTADDWLAWLFPGAEWLCLAQDHPATARTRAPERWYFGAADECGLVVPSPMTGPSGNGLDGRMSHRCLANTGPRRWLVIEFDSGTIDEQAALHWHLRDAAVAAGWPRLTLCVHSGSKSLHGWYGPCEGEEAARDLMAYTVSLGADHSGWNRCQLMRLPGGRRLRKDVTAANLPSGFDEPSAFITQEVFFFDPQ